MREIHAEGTCTRSDVDILMKEQQNKETYTRRRPHGWDNTRRGHYTEGTPHGGDTTRRDTTRRGHHTERILYVQRGYTREGDMRIRRHTHRKNYLHA